MATISSSIRLYDGMSPALRSMNKALNVVLNSFEAMQNASSNPIDTNDIRQARDELAKVETTLDSLEDNIKQADNQQKKFNEDIRNGSSAVSSMKSKFMGLVGIVGSLFGVRKFLNMSDTLTETTARLNMMNDGLQTTEELQRMIFSSAQRSRGSYQDSADAIAKMGIMAKDAFKSNAELVGFMEQINKQFIIAGTSQEGISAATLQLTQAMGSGVLRGEELNSIFEQAPTIIQSIAEYLEVPIGKIRDMAKEGEITADIVKNAMFATADETDARFEKMPKKFGQVVQSMKNQLLMAFQPIFNKNSEIINSDKFNNVVQGGIRAVTLLASVILTTFDGLINIASFVYDNWSWIEPIVWGVISAFIAYNAVSLITNGILAAQSTHLAVKAAAEAIASGATFTATAAQYGLNAALMACPLTWIIILIIAATAAIIGICNWIAKTKNVSDSWFGTMTAGINVVIQFFNNLGLSAANVALGIWEAIKAVTSNMSTAFYNSISNIQGWFYNLLSTALRVVEGICAALNKLPFVEFDYSGITAKADEFASKSAKAYSNKHEYNNVGDAFNKGHNTFDAFRKGWVSDAIKSGAAWGDKVSNKVKGFFGFSNNTFDFGNNLDGIYGNTGDIASSNAKMADSLSASEEDLKYLRDIAERETINRFTTAEININQTNNNNINSEMDIDGVMEKWNDDFTEILDTAAEGVHE